MSTVKTKPKTVSDVVRYEVNPAFTRQAVVLDISNVSGDVTLSEPAGYPIIELGSSGGDGGTYQLALAGDESNVVGILTTQEPITILDGEVSKPVAALVRGAAILSRAGLPVKDIADGDFDIDAISAALAGIDVQVQRNPATTGEQTT